MAGTMVQPTTPPMLVPARLAASYCVLNLQRIFGAAAPLSAATAQSSGSEPRLGKSSRHVRMYALLVYNCRACSYIVAPPWPPCRAAALTSSCDCLRTPQLLGKVTRWGSNRVQCSATSPSVAVTVLALSRAMYFSLRLRSFVPEDVSWSQPPSWRLANVPPGSAQSPVGLLAVHRLCTALRCNQLARG